MKERAHSEESPSHQERGGVALSGGQSRHDPRPSELETFGVVEKGSMSFFVSYAIDCYRWREYLETSMPEVRGSPAGHLFDGLIAPHSTPAWTVRFTLILSLRHQSELFFGSIRRSMGQIYHDFASLGMFPSTSRVSLRRSSLLLEDWSWPRAIHMTTLAFHQIWNSWKGRRMAGARPRLGRLGQELFG